MKFSNAGFHLVRNLSSAAQAGLCADRASSPCWESVPPDWCEPGGHSREWTLVLLAPCLNMMMATNLHDIRLQRWGEFSMGVQYRFEVMPMMDVTAWFCFKSRRLILKVLLVINIVNFYIIQQFNLEVKSESHHKHVSLECPISQCKVPKVTALQKFQLLWQFFWRKLIGALGKRCPMSASAPCVWIPWIIEHKPFAS